MGITGTPELHPELVALLVIGLEKDFEMSDLKEGIQAREQIWDE